MVAFIITLPSENQEKMWLNFLNEMTKEVPVRKLFHFVEIVKSAVLFIHKEEKTGWLNRGITSAFRTLSIWSLQPTFTWPSSWEWKEQQRRTNINLLCSFIPLISSSHPLKMASCGSLLKSAVVGMALLVFVVESGPVGKIKLWMTIPQHHTLRATEIVYMK